MDKNTKANVFSEEEWKKVIETEMSPAEIVPYFYENMKIRNFGDLIFHFNAHDNTKELLIHRLIEFDCNARPDSI